MKTTPATIPFVAGALAIFTGFALTPATADHSRGEEARKVLEIRTLAGVSRPFTGSQNPIRGLAGGGLPWVVGSAQGTLRADGELDLRVRGVVLDPEDPTVIARGLAGKNPVPSFKAVVSCLSVDAEGQVVELNLETDLFPADENGNCRIRDQVSLPTPCVAPILFVTSPTGQWFAATGI